MVRRGFGIASSRGCREATSGPARVCDRVTPAVVVECRSVSKRFPGRLAVDDLDLEVPPGLCFGVLGPNGAGKTTTLKMIYGVMPPSAGSVRVFGIDVASNARAVRSRLGVTLQQNSFIEDLSPLQNLRIFGRFHLLPKHAIEERAQGLLDFLDLRSHASAPVAALSGGFKRRLAVALSLMNRPELLILDEPTTGLDPAVRQALWQRVRDLRAAGTTVLLTTHYMEEAERLCDRIVILSEGKVVADGSPAGLIRSLLAPQVLELDVRVAAESKVLGDLNGVQRRRNGTRVSIYVKEPGALLQTIRRRNGCGWEHHHGLAIRATNLEDVFLMLTGSSLEIGGPEIIEWQS
jgi:lipooligosaccharide transport system ATP-binding protein